MLFLFLFIPELVQMIGNKLNLKFDFLSWSTNHYNKANKTDDDLYSLTLLIDAKNKTLSGVGQSEFKKDGFTLDDSTDGKAIFSMPLDK